MTMLKVLERKYDESGKKITKKAYDSNGELRKTTLYETFYMDLTHDEERHIISLQTCGIEKVRLREDITKQELEKGEKKKKELLKVNPS